MWKTSVTCTTICSQIDRGIPFSVYPSSAPHPGRYKAPLQRPTSSQWRWHEQDDVQPPACYRCPPSPGSPPHAKLSPSTQTRPGTAPAATGRNQATPCSQTFAVGTCATRFCLLCTTSLACLLELPPAAEISSTTTV